MPVDDTLDTSSIPGYSGYDSSQAPADPGFFSQVWANTQNDNVVYKMGMGLSHRASPPEDGYDVFNNIQGYEEHADAFIGIDNPTDAEYQKQVIDMENNNRAMTQGGGAKGVAAGIAAGFLDPTMFIPIGGEAYKTYRTGGRILEGAARTALTVGGIQTADELALHQMSPTRTWEESGANIASSAILGGVLGGAAGGLSAKNLSDLAGKVDEHIDAFNSPEQHVDAVMGDAGAMATDRTTMESLSVKSTIGLKKFKEPVMNYLDKVNAPDWLKNNADKVMGDLSEVSSFITPDARLNNSPNLESRRANQRLVSQILTKFGNTAEGGHADTPFSVEDNIKSHEVAHVAQIKKLDQAFLDYRQEKSVAVTGAKDLLGKITRSGDTPDRKLTHAEFGNEVGKALHMGDAYMDSPGAISEAKSAADTQRKYFNDWFDKAHNIGLVNDEAYEAAKKMGPYTPRMWDVNKIKADETNFKNIVHQHLMNKRDAAASRVEQGLRDFGLDQGPVGEMFKDLKADQRGAAAERAAMERKQAASEGTAEKKQLTVDQVKSRLDELSGQQERLYRKILDGRDRGSEDMSDLFYEFRSTATRKRELFRQLSAREGERDMATARAERREYLAAHLENNERDLEGRVNDFEATLKDMSLDQHKASFSDGELRDTAAQVINQITGTSVGRLGYDNKIEGMGYANPSITGKRGHLKARKFDIPYDMAKDYLNHDAYQMANSYHHSITADYELFKEFGTLDPHDIAREKILPGFERLKEAAGDNKALVKRLNATSERDIKDFVAMWERLRGTFNKTDDYAALWPTLERAAMAMNYMASLGGMVISSLSDPAKVVQRNGIKRVYGGLFSTFGAGMKDIKMSMREANENGAAIELATQNTVRRRLGYDEYAPMGSKVDQALAKAGHAFTTMTLMPMWNDAVRTFAGTVTQNRMLKAIIDHANGKDIGAAEKEYLATNGLMKHAKEIAAQFAEKGELRKNGLYVSNSRLWNDTPKALEAGAALRKAIRKEVDLQIVTPGQDKSLWMSRSGTKLIGQFHSFSVSSWQRTLLSGLQQKDMAALNGAVLSVFLGSLIYNVKSMQAGIEPDNSAGNLIAEGVDRGGLLGPIMDINNVMEKVSSNHVGVRPMLGASPSSRYGSRSSYEAVLGPTFGRFANAVDIAHDVSAGKANGNDTAMVRRMMPFQNLMGVNKLYDAAEGGIDDALGYDRPNRLK